MNAAEFHVSMVADAFSTETRDASSTDIFERIRSGKWRAPVEVIRRTFADVLAKTGDVKEAKCAVDLLKKKLPGVLWSGRFSSREKPTEEKLLARSGLLCGDLDNLGERLPQVRAKLATSSHLFALFTSPTGYGLKAVFRVPADAERHTASFRAVEKHVLELTGEQIDGSRKDLAGLCFVSYDPDALLNRDAIELPPLVENGKPGPAICTASAGPEIGTRQGIAGKLLGTIRWENDVHGFCTCPGRHLHTTGDGERDCEIHLDGAPTVHCFHDHCRGVLAGVNHELRSQIAKAERATSGVAARLGDGLQRAIDDPRPKIRLPGARRLLSDFATELVAVLRDKELFYRGGEVVMLADGDLRPMTPQPFRTWVEQFVIGYRSKRLGENTYEFDVTMTDNEARGTLAAPQFTDALRRVLRVNHTRLPVFSADGKLTLLPQGYHGETQTITSADIDFDLDMPLAAAVETINDLLAEFCFLDDKRSKAVAVAAMVGLFANQCLPEKTLRPCFLFVANAEGAGKTLLAQICITPSQGAMPTGTKADDEDEIRKAILTAVREARAVIFMDNLKGRLSSAALEAFLSAPIWTGRKLGVNESITADNLSTVFITGNGVTVSPDMRRRSLFVELHLEAERAEDRKFKRLLDLPTLLKMRPRILAALWAMVREWDAKGRPPPSRSHSTFPSWADTVGGIVEAAGFACPVQTADVTAAADPDVEDMRRLVTAMADNGSTLTFGELVTVARKHGCFEAVIGADSEELGRKEKAMLARLLTRYDRRLVANRRFVVEGKGHARRYGVEEPHGGMVAHGVSVPKSPLYACELDQKHHADHADHAENAAEAEARKENPQPVEMLL